MRFRYYVADDASGRLVSEGTEDRRDYTAAQLLAHVQGRQPAGRTVLDADAGPRPAAALVAADPLVADYSGAATLDAKVDVIAHRLGLKA